MSKNVVVGKFVSENLVPENLFRKNRCRKICFGKLGVGKSVSENSMSESLLSENSPDTIQIMMTRQYKKKCDSRNVIVAHRYKGNEKIMEAFIRCFDMVNENLYFVVNNLYQTYHAIG